MTPNDIISFWFEELAPKQWWQKDPAFDQMLRDRFSDIHSQAAQCELYEWRESPQGRLAEVIVLDQFSRNMFRDTPNAFACDGLAVALTQAAIQTGDDQLLPSSYHQCFLYMPLMHSESLRVHDLAVKMFSQPGLESNLDFEHKHRVIIERFDRYPHRNQILGRESTPEELAFLKEPGSSF